MLWARQAAHHCVGPTAVDLKQYFLPQIWQPHVTTAGLALLDIRRVGGGHVWRIPCLRNPSGKYSKKSLITCAVKVSPCRLSFSASYSTSVNFSRSLHRPSRRVSARLRNQ